MVVACQSFLFWYTCTAQYPFGIVDFILSLCFLKSLGNKQDNEGALNEDELHRRLELDTLVERYKCPCQVVSILIYMYGV